MIIKTFRFRLFIYFSSAIILTFFLASGIIFIKHKKEMLFLIDKHLIEEVKLNLLTEFEKTRTVKNAEVIRKRGEEYYQIIKREDSFIVASLNDRSHGLPFNKGLLINAFGGKTAIETVRHNDENFRVLYFPADRESVIRVSHSLSSKEQDLAGLKRLFIVSFPFIFFISAGLGWLIAGMAVSPLNKLKASIEQIVSKDSGDRININVKGEEFQNLIKIFNEIFIKIETLTNAQKRFASDVSHEIRSPLTSLRGNIEVALRKKRTEQEYEEILRNSLIDIMRISKITDNLLFLTKADNNILQFRKQWIDINHLLRGIVEQYNDRAITEGLTIVEDYEQKLEINCDRDMLEQAFSNLIENAIKYTPSGGMIKIKTFEEEGKIKISISDSGIGIPAEDIPHIFERFYRSKKDVAIKKKGAGLGLALTKWIIDSHEGNIEVKSVEGIGSEFLIILPKSNN